MDNQVTMTFQATKCPLCDRYAAGGWSHNIYGDRVLTCGWTFRRDLMGAVCPRCNAILGIDTGRVKMLEKYYPEALAKFEEEYAFDAKFRYLPDAG